MIGTSRERQGGRPTVDRFAGGLLLLADKICIYFSTSTHNSLTSLKDNSLCAYTDSIRNCTTLSFSEVTEIDCYFAYSRLLPMKPPNQTHNQHVIGLLEESVFPARESTHSRQNKKFALDRRNNINSLIMTCQIIIPLHHSHRRARCFFGGVQSTSKSFSNDRSCREQKENACSR